MYKSILLLLAICCFSCQNNPMSGADFSATTMKESESMDFERSEADAYNGNDQSSDKTASDTPIERKIIRTAHFRMQVDNVERSSAKIQALIEQKGGFINSTDLSNSGSYINNHITIRIPNEKLDSLLELIGKEASHIDYKRVSAQDVTEEFVDIQIRLKTKKEVRDRYIEVLKNKAQTVEEILNAEERIRVIQEEIESKEGRLRYLSNQVSLSTIHLEVYQHDGKGIARASYLSQIGRAFSRGWDNIKGFVLVLVNLWPFLIILGIGIYYFRKWRRAR